MTKEILLKGNVQGVGMRYFIANKARELGINGYVKNLSNGAVLCVVQTNNQAIETLVKTIKNNSPGFIDSYEVDTIETKEIYSEFDIKV